ncbi:MAG: hypothetical protein DRG78_04885 [Epsilonproteobacteria bacterium]|nr:MAG: hypothetical protein DRG78_04885 [Campylobacterota bacterium]
MAKVSKTRKVTISISEKFYSELSLHADSLDLSVNTMLKQAALSSFNKANLTFLTPENRLLIQQFQKNQIVLANILKQLQSTASNGNAIPVSKIINNLHIYQEDFLEMIEKVGNST